MNRLAPFSWAVACVALLAASCGQPSTSSSSHWLSCVNDADCSNLPEPATCGGEGYCVAGTGRKLERVVVFEDEFDGSSLDPASYRAETGFSVRNGDAEYYTGRAENIALRAGELVLTARAEELDGAAFTSGSIETSGLRSWTYGRIEARIWAPDGRGCGPAFWMMPEASGAPVRVCDAPGSCTEGEWPAWGDIVIMTTRSETPDQVFHTASYATLDAELGELTRAQGGGGSTLEESVAAGYHDYAIEWGPERIDWLIDGERRASFDTTAPSLYHPEGENPFQRPFHVRLSLAVGGLSEAPEPSDYPQELRVDWLRVSQYE